MITAKLLVSDSKGVEMQAEEEKALRQAWIKKGSPLCDHSKLAREYYLGSNTGDYVCTICGEVNPVSGWPERVRPTTN